MQTVYYRDKQGHQPVEKFIDALPLKHQVTVDLAIDRLNDMGANEPPLPFPVSSQVDGELRELRCHYGPVLYRRSKNLFVLLHIVRKNSAKIPPADIQTAQARWEDFKERMDAERRRRPRAAGDDAP